MSLQMLRTSERNSYKRCMWQWWHEYVLELRVADPRPGAAEFGSGLHYCLGEWYKPGKKRGVHLVKTWRKWMEGQHGQFVRIDDLSDPEHDGQAKFEDALVLGEEMLIYYLEMWGKDQNWTILAPEQRFSVRIPHPDNPQRAVVNYVGTIDGIYRDEDDGCVRLLENKSTNKNLARFLTDISWSEQFGGYNSVATHTCREQGLIGPKESVRGMTYNLLRRARQDDRPVNADGQRTNKPTKEHYVKALQGVDPTESEPYGWPAHVLQKKTIAELEGIAAGNYIEVFGEVSARQPTAYFLRETIDKTAKQRNRQILRIGEEALHMRKVRAGNLPILKTPTMDCSWQCEFHDLCQIDENGDDYEYFKSQVFQKTDPYEDHRPNAANSKTGN